ncbi:MAG: hypothetical protein FWF10_04730 [Clostridiales bacterium]|nr:hypothetical protein [Clostridiales bacterium]
MASLLVLALLCACVGTGEPAATEEPVFTPEIILMLEPTEAPTAEPTEESVPSPTYTGISNTFAPGQIQRIGAKPVIYLYPEKPIEATVQLRYKGTLDFTYPSYDNGWRVKASPDGTLIDLRDGREYSYLFWEGHNEADYDFSRGFVIKGEDTVAFLQEKLAYMGLLPKEYNEFIVYWLPQMQNNAYNLITFQGEAYINTAELIIAPAPDSILRVFMVFLPLDAPIQIEEQTLSPFTRTGFTVIEWGGCAIVP